MNEQGEQALLRVVTQLGRDLAEQQAYVLALEEGRSQREIREARNAAKVGLRQIPVRERSS